MPRDNRDFIETDTPEQQPAPPEHGEPADATSVPPLNPDTPPPWESERTAGLLRTNAWLQAQLVEREQSEAALRETQQILSNLISNVPCMVYRCRNDRQRTMEFVSQGSLELTGYTPDELTRNRSVAYTHLIHPAHRNDLFQAIATALEKQHPFRQVYRIITATGCEKWVWEQGRPVCSPDGDILHIEGVITDHTDGMRAYRNLEQHVEERTQEVRRRRLVAEALRDILTILNSNRSLEEILEYIVTQAIRLLGASAAAIYRLQPEDHLLTVRAYYGLPDEYATIKLEVGQGATGMAVQRRQPVAISDPDVYLAQLEDTGVDPDERDLIVRIKSYFRTILSVPLMVKDEVYGGITVYHPGPHEFSPEDIALAVSFADQAALAIENARLREQAERAAVAAERSRLARDLHDAVTQTLFSASLIAEVLPRLWERNPDVGRQRLEELRQLTRGALAEMRTLLLELRPMAFAEVELSELLRQLTEAVAGRARMPISLVITGQRDLPADVRIALYRITQEALNNVAKHARASHAAVQLHYTEHGARLLISDNGGGFQPEHAASGHLGLDIVRERAEAIGADLQIDSQPGTGTRITVIWTDAPAREEL